MEDYQNLISRCILNVKKLILDAKYYRYDRSEWEEDCSPERLALAEANLKQAGVLTNALVKEIERERREKEASDSKEAI